MFRTSVLALFFALIVGGAQAFASIQGLAVGSNTGTTMVGSVDGSGDTIYYIPLASDGSTSGLYGVTDTGGGSLAGTFSDSGSGFGYNPASGLNMIIYYDLTDELIPSSATEISFQFDDLDLADINDPNGFFESVRFNYIDDSGSEVALTDTLTDLSAGFGSVAAGVSASLDSDGGLNDPLTLTFSGSGLTDIVNDVADSGGIYEDAFYLSVWFGSEQDGSGGNTSEAMSSVLRTQQQAIPEPGSIIIWSVFGLSGLVLSQRRRT